MTVGVHSGSSEFKCNNLRYIQIDLNNLDKNKSLLENLEYIYLNSSGCLLDYSFKLTAE